MKQLLKKLEDKLIESAFTILQNKCDFTETFHNFETHANAWLVIGR